MNFDFLSGINTLGGGLLGYLIPFLFVLTLVVFFHELGHFLVARRCGVRVLVFSIGFGPELFGFNDRHGTRWKLSAIPLGGYVKFFGDENAASVPDAAALAAMTDEERRHSFVHQSVARRAAVVVAGPVANFLLAIVIFAALFMVFGKPSTSPRVDAVQPGSAAEAAGFQPGDLVLTIDGRPVESFPDMQQIVSTSAGETLVFGVDRGGVKVTLKATPALKESKDRFGNVHRIGVLGITRTRTSSRSGRSKRLSLACKGPGLWSSERCPISAASFPVARPPINSEGRFASLKFPGRSQARDCRRCSA
jgi:regulator of sigma E protease